MVHGRRARAPWTSVALVVLGSVLVMLGAATYAWTSTSLREANVIVSPRVCLGGEAVAGPFTAYCQSTADTLTGSGIPAGFGIGATAFVAGIALMLAGIRPRRPSRISSTASRVTNS